MPEFKDLAARWMAAKGFAESAKQEMLALEAEMLAHVESVEGGSKTTHKDGYKVVVKRPVKVEPDAKGCEWLAGNRPDLWTIAAEAITEKLGKPGFTVEAEE